MKSEEQGPFTDHEIALARVIADLTVLAFPGRRRSGLDSTRLSEAGLLVFAATGDLAYQNLAAHQSLWMLARGGEKPIWDDRADSVHALAERYCSEVVTAARQSSFMNRTERCHWGDFELRSEASGDKVAVVIMQYRPFGSHVARRLVSMGMPARRLTVCWLAISGLSRKEIATVVGISADTVSEHLDAVFTMLGVRSTTELLLRFAA